MATTNGHDDGPAQFFRDFLDECVGPYVVTVGDVEYELDAPPPIIGDALDAEDSYTDLLDCLVDDDEVADELLDHFSSRPHSALVDFVEGALDHWALVNPPRAGFRRVISELERYGAAIEFDLRDMLLVDLSDFVTDPARWPWSKFMRYLDGIGQYPGHHYTSALALDVELAEAVAEQKAEDEKNGIRRPERRPALIGWTSERAELVKIFDSTRRVEHAAWGASPKFRGKGGKGPKRSPHPRVAADLIEARRLRLEHDTIAGKMLGRRFTPSTERGAARGR